MSDSVLTHEQILYRIRVAVRDAVGKMPTEEDALPVLTAMIEERDRTGVCLTPVAKQALGEFRAACRLPGPQAHARGGALKLGAPAVAIIALARETEGGRGGHGGHGTAGRDGGAGL